MAPGRDRATIHDVAALAGVSKSLVSLVMRGSPRVSPERRKAVLDAARQLGYRPNAAARSLVQRRTDILGVLVSDIHNPFFAEIIDGIETGASHNGYTALLVNGYRDPARELAHVETFLELRADGVIMLDPRLKTRQIEEVAASVPTAVVARRMRSPLVDTVSNDDHAGAVMATEHLVGLGHRRIAHIAAGPGVGGGAARRRGYEQAMRRAELSANIQVAVGSYTEEGGYEAARALLRRTPYPTAVFAANDLAAIGCMTALTEAGLQVPQDVSLVGYDNTHLAGIRHISLTSVNQPRSEMGHLAVSALHERLTGARDAAQRIVLEPELVERLSSTKPPVD